MHEVKKARKDMKLKRGFIYSCEWYLSANLIVSKFVVCQINESIVAEVTQTFSGKKLTIIINSKTIKAFNKNNYIFS